MENKGNLTPEQVRKLLTIDYITDVISYDTLVKGRNDTDDDATIKDILKDETYCPENLLLEKDAHNTLCKCVKKLKVAREQAVIIMRFGLIDGHPMTLDEVGKQYGVTRERVRQVEQKALAHLRAIMKKEGYTAEDF